MHLPWPRSLVVLGVLGAGLTLLVAGTAIFSLAGTVTTAGEMGQLTRAQRLHQDADMMHDALRADVGTAREALQEAQSPGTDGIVARTEADADNFQSDIDELREMKLPPAVAKELSDLRPAQEEYIETARGLVRSMLRTGEVDSVAFAQFVDMFQALVPTQAECERAAGLLVGM